MKAMQDIGAYLHMVGREGAGLHGAAARAQSRTSRAQGSGAHPRAVEPELWDNLKRKWEIPVSNIMAGQRTYTWGAELRLQRVLRQTGFRNGPK